MRRALERAVRDLSAAVALEIARIAELLRRSAAIP